ncbi:trypco2 family protein [Rhodococcus koreensis]|uniref:trypco2 family protein n=1 Tax=Rhodococcus koreensis TaxID=99653 RepID=UPI00366A9125
MVEELSVEVPKGVVPLSAAIWALRNEVIHAVRAGQYPYELNGQHRTLRIKPAPIEVTLEVVVTTTGTAKTGVKWWLIESGGELAREKTATQTIATPAIPTGRASSWARPVAPGWWSPAPTGHSPSSAERSTSRSSPGLLPCR